MPDFTQQVETSFIALSIGSIFIIVGIGILLVKIKKKSTD